MRIRIQKFSITNYRSCLNVSFTPHPDLSALIGKNASGKSSILNGIVLLKSLFAQTGNPHHSDTSNARSRINVKLKYGRKTVLLRADVYYSATETTRDEVLGAKLSWNLKEFSGVDEWISVPFGIEREIFRHSHYMRSAVISRHSGQIDFNWRYLDVPKRLQKSFGYLNKLYYPILQFFSGISYYSASQFTDPTKCPVSVEVEDERIKRRGFRAVDHSKFLYDLYKIYSSKGDSREYKEFLSIVGPTGLKLIDLVYFRQLELPQSSYEVRVGGRVVRKRSQRRLLIPYFKVDGNRLSPNQLSEGTFKTIALLFYLVIDKGSLLLIEEPEVCVHHGLLRSILELVKSYSLSKQIIISTHSDFVLDMLRPENVFLVRKERRQGTNVKAVTKTLSVRDFGALKNYLAETGNLGEFWRHGGLAHD